MEQISLTDEEILKVYKDRNWLIFAPNLIRSRAITKAQLKKVMKRMKEYGFAVSNSEGEPIGFNLPWEKWQSLLKEVE